MLFYEPAFLVFALSLLALLAGVRTWRPRKTLLLVASWVFYMWWNPAFVLLILASTVVDFVVGRRMGREENPRRRKLLLAVSLVTNLGLLGWFKYAGFFQANLLWIARELGYEPSWTTLAITLPVGISFYTFQTLSYTIDVYRRQLEPTDDPLDFALFVAFFPQLVAGPIVRARDFLPQLVQSKPLFFDTTTGFLIVRGLAKKVLVADNLAVFADPVMNDPQGWPSIVVWLGVLCFAVQIYCDFSGYSDIAIGIARVLGFTLPQNFDRPFFACSPTDMWKRWHISLSSWLRDYVYISFGGNRGGFWASNRNLMLTMLLGGLWHGAAWQYVRWGFLHGVLLFVHRIYHVLWARCFPEREPPTARGRVGHVASVFAMQYAWLITLLCFRIETWDDTIYAIEKFVVFDFDLSIGDLGLGAMAPFSSALLLVVFFAVHLESHLRGDLHERLGRRGPLVVSLAGIVVGVAFFYGWPLERAPFIYFQF